MNYTVANTGVIGLMRLKEFMSWCRYSPCVISEDQFVAGTQDHLYSHPVAITITAYFKGRQLDPDNIASKFYIDGLKGWLITDDTPKYVDSVTTRSRVDKLNPRIEIELKEIE